MEGQTPAAVSAAALDAVIAESFVPRDGLRATWAYRSLVARNLVLRFLQEAQQEPQAALDTAA
jgi:xanthine dehydrogenase small subunit